MKDLIYAMMLESFNDCAVVIAEQVAGTTEHFSKMMNDYAKKIGCADTFFITPNGLDAQKDSQFHHTTAEDLAQIMRYCIKESPEGRPVFKNHRGGRVYVYGCEWKICLPLLQP